MNRLPQMASVTELRNDYLTLFAKLKNGPVVLAQRSKPAAVLISAAQWDDIARRLDQYELLAQADRIDAEMDADPSKVVTHEELKRRIAAKTKAKTLHVDA